MNDVCHCGHVYDEHSHGHECDVDGCACIHFEADPDAIREPDEDGR